MINIGSNDAWIGGSIVSRMNSDVVGLSAVWPELEAAKHMRIFLTIMMMKSRTFLTWQY